MQENEKNMQLRSLRWQNNRLFILDQQCLPGKIAWLEIKNVSEMIQAIKGLSIRGAPLIGVGAALALYRHALEGTSGPEIQQEALKLREARPTAINLMHAMDRMATGRNPAEITLDHLRQTAFAILDEDIQMCLNIARNGLNLIPEGSILTHCNTGGLATAGIGTALGVLEYASQQGKKIHVYVDETRPLLQGGRLTAWELEQASIPATLICDNMAGALMQQGKIQAVILGSDRIALNGDFANKTGTYSVAVLAHHHRIPFYVAAPYTTLDANCASGRDIPVEERNAEEVRGLAYGPKRVIWSPPAIPAFNPAFDVTPVELVTGFILDTGYYSQADVKNGRMQDAFQKLRQSVAL